MHRLFYFFRQSAQYFETSFSFGIVPSVVLSLALIGLSHAAEKQASSLAQLPFLLYDSHVHFISADFERYPLVNPSSAAEQARRDAVREAILNAPNSAEHILSVWDANHVEAGVGVQYRTAYGTDNSYLLDSAAHNAGRVASVVVLDASDHETPSRLRSMVQQHGVVGVRLTGFADAQSGATPWLDSPAALDTWAVANDLRLVVVVMSLPGEVTNLEVLRRIDQLATRYPMVKIELDHVAWPSAGGAPTYGLTPTHVLLKTHPNIYYKFTSINVQMLNRQGLASADFLRHVVDVYGADHVLWGSDYGNTPKPYSEMVTDAVAATAKLSAYEQRLVLRDTGQALFTKGSP